MVGRVLWGEFLHSFFCCCCLSLIWEILFVPTRENQSVQLHRPAIIRSRSTDRLAWISSLKKHRLRLLNLHLFSSLNVVHFPHPHTLPKFASNLLPNQMKKQSIKYQQPSRERERERVKESLQVQLILLSTRSFSLGWSWFSRKFHVSVDFGGVGHWLGPVAEPVPTPGETAGWWWRWKIFGKYL